MLPIDKPMIRTPFKLQTFTHTVVTEIMQRPQTGFFSTKQHPDQVGNWTAAEVTKLRLNTPDPPPTPFAYAKK